MSAGVEAPREQSWRGIRQAVNTRTMTKQGRRRLGWSAVRACCTLVTLGGLGAVGVYVWQALESPAESLPSSVKGAPLEDVIVLTDGVLTRSWVMDRLGLPETISLMAVDLARTKATLEATGQVRTAVVARDFPGTLVVTLEERVPIARVQAAIDPKKPEALFVAPDGVVYRGYNYDAAMIARLPWLAGFRLVRRGEGFAPVQGLERVAELLLAAGQEAPHLAQDWKIISLAEMPRLVARMSDGREVVFERGAYRRQLAWLDYILDFYRARPEGPAVARIDLSVGARAGVEHVAQVPVTFAPGRGAPAAAGLSIFSRSSSNNQTHRGFQR